MKFSTDGGVQLNGLRAYKDKQGFHAVSGRCLANAKVKDENGKVEELRFPSKYFQVVIRDMEDPVLPTMPEDSKSRVNLTPLTR